MTGLSQEQLELLIDRVADQVGTWQPPRDRRHPDAGNLARQRFACGGRHDNRYKAAD
jgi:hypothetical protein